VEAFFLRVVDATRDAKGHKGNGIFIILEGNWANANASTCSRIARLCSSGAQHDKVW
jgi:hypothetical protein